MKKKWLRRIVILFLVLAILIGAANILLSFYFSHIEKSRRRRVLSAMESARSIRVEVFDSQSVLAKRELDATERASLLKLLPTIIPRGLGLRLELCFVPHHRIIGTSPAGTEFTVEICFECNMVRDSGSPSVYDLPKIGRVSLIQFFKEIGIRVQEQTESPEVP